MDIKQQVENTNRTLVQGPSNEVDHQQQQAVQVKYGTNGAVKKSISETPE